MPSGGERRSGRVLAAPLTLLAFVLSSAFSSPRVLAVPDPAESVPSGTERSGDLVSIGKALAIAGEVDGAVIAIGGRVTVTGRVRGDLVVLGGDALVAEGGRVGGDLLVVGGNGATAGSGSVAGRVRTVSALEAAFLTELRTSPLERGQVSVLLAAFRLLLLTFWLTGGLALLRWKPRRVQQAAGALPAELATAAGLGVSAVLSGVLLATFFLAALPPPLAILLVAALLALLVAAKLFGLAALFVVAGRRLARGAKRGSPLFGDPAALAVGLLPFGLASLVPAVGPLVWGAVSVVGIGLAVRTAFGTSDPVLSVARA
jgi:hypothetical protein